jgi:hypothetical protein
MDFERADIPDQFSNDNSQDELRIDTMPEGEKDFTMKSH